MIILDTDVLSIVQRADGPECDNLADKLDSAGEEVAVSIVSFEEQMRGWLAFIARAKSASQLIKGYAKLHALLEDFNTRPILDFDQPSALQFERLKASRVRGGSRLVEWKNGLANITNLSGASRSVLRVQEAG